MKTAAGKTCLIILLSSNLDAQIAVSMEMVNELDMSVSL
jgi:hypothetical protein